MVNRLRLDGSANSLALPCHIRYWWLIAFISIYGLAAAQDTVFRFYPQLTRYVLVDSIWQPQALDTALGSWHRYHPADKDFRILHAGYLGAPAYWLSWCAPEAGQFQVGFQNFEVYRKKPSQVAMYDTRQPFTVLRYQQGSKQEILVGFTHAQNISPRWSAGVDFFRMRYLGGYQRQQARISNGSGYVRYQSARKVYNGAFMYFVNAIHTEVNGGITHDTLFDSNAVFDKQLVPIALRRAGDNLREDGLLMLQSWVIGTRRDTSQADTFAHSLAGLRRLEHRSELISFRRWFADEVADSMYYGSRWPSGLQVVQDDYLFRSLVNTLSLCEPAGRRLSGCVSLQHSLGWVTNESFQDAITNGDVLWHLKIPVREGLALSFAGSYTLWGRNRDDYLLQPVISWQYRSYRFRWFAQLSAVTDALVASSYFSAFYQWNEAPMVSRVQSVGAEVSNTLWRWKLSGRIFRQGNALYWRHDSLMRYRTDLSGWILQAVHHANTGSFHVLSEALLQSYVPDSVVYYPQFVVRTSMYWEQSMFGRSLRMRGGIDVRYHSSHYAPIYLVPVAQWSTQNVLLNRYHPQIDLFIDVRIRALHAFVLIQHAAQGLLGKGNFNAYRYPAADRSFKIGLQWMFWN